MKVKYIKVYTDEYGDTMEPGWVAEHTDAEGERRISKGVCEKVDDNARAFKYKLDAPLSIEECVSHEPKEPESPIFKGAKAIK